MAFIPTYSSVGDTVSGYLIDCIFLFDILLNFRTTYINLKNGLEVFDSKAIAKNYVTQWRFYTDILSIIPFELFYEAATKGKSSSSKTFKVFDLLKLIRLLRLGRIISYMKFN